MNISVLNEHASASKFAPTTHIDLLAHELLIERWYENISYELYYKDCKPKQCFYVYVQRFVVGCIVSKILGIVGDLPLPLRITVPRLVKICKEIYKEVMR